MIVDRRLRFGSGTQSMTRFEILHAQNKCLRLPSIRIGKKMQELDLQEVGFPGLDLSNAAKRVSA